MAQGRDIDVLHLIGTLSTGGAERNLYYLAPWMAKSKLRYGICCLIKRGDLAEEIERLGIPVFELGYRKRYALPTILRLRRLLKGSRVKVLHTHLFEPGVVGRVSAWLAGVPVIITHEHGKTLWKRWYHRLFERLAILGTDLRVAASADIRDLRLKHEHTPPAKIVVVANAVEPAVFDVSAALRDKKRAELDLADSFVIGAVGRLVAEKSFDFLLRVAHAVCRSRPDARFVLVGEGSLCASLIGQRDSLGLTDKFIFLGQRADIPELLAAMDLYVITSAQEGLPISLLEAMVAAKPIVSTEVGGIPEALGHGESGLLVAIGDEDAFVEAILALASDPDRMKALGRSARAQAIKHYSAREVLETLERTYSSILARKHATLSGS
jgi:glycosyltransferase involved in cell wall biosynthesis